MKIRYKDSDHSSMYFNEIAGASLSTVVAFDVVWERKRHEVARNSVCGSMSTDAKIPTPGVMQATVRRLNDPSSVRLLDVGTLQAALQTLIASRQLASYNKLQGTIVRQALKQGSEQETRASQSDYLAGGFC